MAARLALPPPSRRHERVEAGELLRLNVEKPGRITRVGHARPVTGRSTVGATCVPYLAAQEPHTHVFHQQAIGRDQVGQDADAINNHCRDHQD
jgi:hypothetical protein